MSYLFLSRARIRNDVCLQDFRRLRVRHSVDRQDFLSDIVADRNVISDGYVSSYRLQYSDVIIAMNLRWSDRD